MSAYEDMKATVTGLIQLMDEFGVPAFRNILGPQLDTPEKLERAVRMLLAGYDVQHSLVRSNRLTEIGRCGMGQLERMRELYPRLVAEVHGGG